MLPENTIYFIAVLQIAAAMFYNYDVIRGRNKPNRVSWLFWGILGILAYFASRDEGAGTEALFTLLVGVNPMITFFTSFVNKKSYWKISQTDYMLGGFAAIGILLWLITGDGLLGLLFFVVADFSAGIPTLVKAYKFPETENGVLFGVCSFNAILTLLTIDNYSIANSAFPLYIFFFCGTMFAFANVRPWLKAKEIKA